MDVAVQALVGDVTTQAIAFTQNWSSLIAIPIAIAAIGMILGLVVSAFRR